jgi:predicted HTH transcriptional regulator
MTDLLWEDNLLERKTESDLKDLLKTLVAFANSVKPGHTATILVGEKDDGTVQGVKNPDSIQKTVRETCDKIYPPILWRAKFYEKDGKPCVQVEVEYDGETPHFGGAAWVRRGSESLVATDEVFQRLIDYRSDKVRELAKWLDREVTISGDKGILKQVIGQDDKFVVYNSSSPKSVHPRWPRETDAILRVVNRFWATFEVQEQRKSEPLEKLVLSWDDARDRLRILVKI